MELLRTALRENADLATGCAAVFSRVVSSEDLDFLGRIDVRRAQTGAVGARTGRRSAIIRDQILGVPGTVEIRRSLAEVETQVCQRAATSARHEVRHENRISSVQLERIDLFPRYVLLDCRGFGLE